MKLDIEKDLSKLPVETKVRLTLMTKGTPAIPKHVFSAYTLTISQLMVKTGGGRKKGDRLTATIRAEVLKHLESDGLVCLTVFTEKGGS